MTLQLLQLLDSITIGSKIYEKISIPQLCRLRMTCKRVDTSVEENRFVLSKKRRSRGFSVVVLFSSDKVAVNYESGRKQGKCVLSNPYKQLSAVYIDTMFIEVKPGTTFETQGKMLNLLRRLKPALYMLCINKEGAFSPEMLLGMIADCSFLFFSINTQGVVSIDRVLSLDSVQNAKDLELSIDGNDIPVEGFLQQIKKLKRIEFNLGSANHPLHNMITQMIQDALIFEEEEPLPTINFVWAGEPLNLASILPNLRLIFDDLRSDMPLDLYQAHALALPKKIFLIFYGERDDIDDRACTIRFVKKGKNSLKKALEKTTGDPLCDRILDRIFKDIVGAE